jgi:hypothetical protein
LLLFYKDFHGDNGAGLGASHRTGWTGIVARMLHLFASTSSAQVVELGQAAVHTELARPQDGRTVAVSSGQAK